MIGSITPVFDLLKEGARFGSLDSLKIEKTIEKSEVSVYHIGPYTIYIVYAKIG
jgi:hypothetical protein